MKDMRNYALNQQPGKKSSPLAFISLSVRCLEFLHLRAGDAKLKRKTAR